MRARTLSERANDSIIPEPVIFTVDQGGQHHFATEMLPWRTVIDIQGLPVFPWVKLDLKNAAVTIALDGRTAVYKRRGYGFHRSHWICDLERQ